MKSSPVRLRFLTSSLPAPKYGDPKTGWSKLHAYDPAMPGIGCEAHVGNAVTVKSKWARATDMTVPMGANIVDFEKEKAKLSDGPRGLGERVNDFMGMPTSSDTYAAAKWKVDRLGRVNDDYKIENQGKGTRKGKPRPRLLPASQMSGDGASRANKWRNYLQRIKGSSADPLVRDATDQRKFAPTLEEEVNDLVRKANVTGDQLRSKEPARPWEVNRDLSRGDADDEPERESIFQQTDATREGLGIPATAVWVYCWANEWDTQVKIACPWDHKLIVHRCSAELPWALEQQWNSQEVARELVKDCVEDFFDMCKKKGYLQGERMPAIVCMNGFWQQRRGIIQGLNEMRPKLEFVEVADITPIPINEVEMQFPIPDRPPDVAMYQCRIKAEEHQATSIM